MHGAQPVSSTFDAAHGQAGGHPAAEQVIDHHRRDRVDDRRRHHVVPRRLVAVEELRQRHRHRHAAFVRQQQELVEILVPGEQQRVGADRDQRRRHQRQVDAEIDLQRRGAVDPRRLVELDRDAAAVLLEDEDRVGRGEGHLDRDDRPDVVAEPVALHDPVERDRQERGRDHDRSAAPRWSAASRGAAHPADRKADHRADARASGTPSPTPI